MRRFNENMSIAHKVLLLFLCGILLLGSFSGFAFATEDSADTSDIPEYFVGNNREEILLDGNWKTGFSEYTEDSLPEILPEESFCDSEIILPSYTQISADVLLTDNSLLWYEKSFYLANKPDESVVIDLGVDSGIVAAYVNNMKAESKNISDYLKAGVNKLTIVREHSADNPRKFHFIDTIKLIFSNSPMILSADVISDLKDGSVSFEIDLFNALDLTSKTDVVVSIFDSLGKEVANYTVDDVEILGNGNSSVMVSGVKISGFSDKSIWSANKPIVYNAKIIVSGDTLTIPFGMLPDNLFGTSDYKYGMDIIVSDFMTNPNNKGKAWNIEWVNSFFEYLKDISWNVITYRDGYLPSVWHQEALKQGILLIDKNDDAEWISKQDLLWTPEVNFIDKASAIKNENPDSIIFPVVYNVDDGLFGNTPQFTNISKIRIQNIFKANVINTDNSNEEDKGFFEGIIDYFQEMIHKTFIKDNRWQLFATGLGNTLLVAAAATVFGVFIGIIIAVIKVVHHQSVLSKKKNPLLKILNLIAEAYTAVIRGTPVVVQLLITYNVIFVFSDEAVLIGIFAFSINSGAYISEIIRAGINSVDKGQTEAGRSLGLSQFTTMKSIVLPQALKNILPALGNEFIALLKETSVIGYLGVVDLTRAGELVRSRTADAFFTLIFVAVIYFVLVFGLTALFKYFERRLGKSDKN